MKRLVEYKLTDGDPVVVEIEVPESAEDPLPAGIDEVLETADLTFEAALDKIKPALATAFNRVKSVAETADSVNIEFGIKLNASAGAILASTGGEAHFKVVVTWKRG